MYRKSLIVMCVSFLASCASPADQVGEIMAEADSRMLAAASAGVPAATCLRIDGIVDLSGNPFVSANAKIILIKKSPNAPEC